MQSFDKKVKSCYYERGGDNMEKEEKKVFTLRIPKSLHFEIEKSANKESRTLNSWFLNVAKQYIEEQNKKRKK